MFDWFLKLRVTLVLKCGSEIRFLCDKISTKQDHENNLTAINVESSVGWPLYLRLGEVAAIRTQKVSRWARYR
jgi:hypothetical protein